MRLPPVGRLVARAAGKGPEQEPEDADPEPQAPEDVRKNELMAVLQSRGMDLRSAKEMLRVWKEFGIESSDDLRVLLVQRSRSAVTSVAVQLLLDTVACVVASGVGGALVDAGGLAVVPGLLSYALACYYGFQVVFGGVTVGTLLASGVVYGADADALMRAVKQLADEDREALGRLGLVAKAREAINMVKIVGSLNRASSLLKEQKAGAGGPASTLENLSAYLTLSNAERRFGFEPAKYGMSEADAMDIAVKFARLDLNDDGCLELSEMERLFEAMGMQMSPGETQAALDLLDMNRSGLVEFEEFVEWYTNKIPEALGGGPAQE